jgi:hypothetical protein
VEIEVPAARGETVKPLNGRSHLIEIGRELEPPVAFRSGKARSDCALQRTEPWEPSVPGGTMKRPYSSLAL